MKKRVFSNLALSALLLLALMISSSGIYFAQTNSQAGTGFSFLAVVFLAVSIAIGLGTFAVSLSQHNTINAIREELTNLKKQLDYNKNSKSQKKQEENVSQAAVNPTTIAQEMLPAVAPDDLEKYFESVLQLVAKKLEIAQAVVFIKDPEQATFSFKAGYAYYSESAPPVFAEGETLPGQVAKNKEALIIDTIPEGYITVLSGLGSSSPRNLLIAPIIDSKSTCYGVLELASFKLFTKNDLEAISHLGVLIGEKLGLTKNTSQD